MVPFFIGVGFPFSRYSSFWFRNTPPQKKEEHRRAMFLFLGVWSGRLPAHVTCMFYRLITFMALPLFTFTK